MVDLETLVLFHNSPERAKIYNIVANKIWNDFDIHGTELCLACSYVINTLIEEGKLYENTRSVKS